MATAFYNSNATITTATASNYGTTNTTSNYYWSTTTTPIQTQQIQTSQYYQPQTYTVDYNYFNDLIKKLQKEENEQMTNDFYFGSYDTQNIRLSMYGMAIKNKAGKWVSYDTETHSLIDVEIFNIEIDAGKIFFKLPKPTNEIKAGDIILHNNRPVFVENVREDGKFEVIDPSEGTAITILPLKSPFGFNYIPIIVSLTDFLPKADKDSPFGNLLPLLLTGSDNNGLAIAMMMQDKDIDPMMMAMLCGKGDMSTLMLMMMMDKKKSDLKFGAGATRHAIYPRSIEDIDE